MQISKHDSCIHLHLAKFQFKLNNSIFKHPALTNSKQTSRFEWVQLHRFIDSFSTRIIISVWPTIHKRFFTQIQLRIQSVNSTDLRNRKEESNVWSFYDRVEKIHKWRPRLSPRSLENIRFSLCVLVFHANDSCSSYRNRIEK